MSSIVRNQMARHRIDIERPAIDLTTRCIDIILSHPEIIRPEWDTDEEKKVIIEKLKADVYKEVIKFLDKEIASMEIKIDG